MLISGLGASDYVQAMACFLTSLNRSQRADKKPFTATSECLDSPRTAAITRENPLMAETLPLYHVK